jgi:hypothetical protein
MPCYLHFIDVLIITFSCVLLSYLKLRKFIFLKLHLFLQYATAEAQLHMHEEYDDYLASGILDDYIYESMSLEL